MMGFSFTDAAARGYGFVWQARAILMRMVALPVSIKAGSFIAIHALALEDNFLRQGLILLPAYFIEGWLIAHVIRMAILGESPLTDPRTLPPAEFSVRRRALLGSAIMYVIIKMAATLVASIMFDIGQIQPAAGQTAPEPGGAAGIILIILTLAGIWSFRFFWLYIPVALDWPMEAFLRRIQSFMISFSMMGVWIVSMTPAIFIVLMLSSGLESIFPDLGPQTPAPARVYILALAQAAVETPVALIAAIGIAFGLRDVLSGSDRPKPK